MACSSRGRTPTRGPSTRPTTPTGRSSRGTRRACSIATARRPTHNIPHNFQFGWVYELPFGAGKKWATSGASSAILGGWQLNGVFAAYQGRPFTLSASGASLNMPGNEQTAGPGQSRRSKSWATSAMTARSSTPRAFARVTEVRFGNVGRNTMRGPGVVNLDLSLFRTFKLTRQVKLQFRVEAFNVSNTPHFANPNSNVNSSDFGRVLATRLRVPRSAARGSSASACACRSSLASGQSSLKRYRMPERGARIARREERAYWA